MSSGFDFSLNEEIYKISFKRKNRQESDVSKGGHIREYFSIRIVTVTVLCLCAGKIAVRLENSLKRASYIFNQSQLIIRRPYRT